MQDQILELATQNTTESNAHAAQISMGEGAKITDNLLKILTELNGHVVDDLHATDEATNVQYANSSNTLIAMTAFPLHLLDGDCNLDRAWDSRGLKKVAFIADAVAIGDLNQKVEVRTNDEIKDLIDTVNVMTANLRNTASLADSIAMGDLFGRYRALSDKDTLGIAMQSMVSNLRATAAVADTIANGDLTVEAKPLSDGCAGSGAGAHARAAAQRRLGGDRAARTCRRAARSCRRARRRCRRVRPSRRPRPRKRPLRWRRWPPTSSRTPTTRPRPRRSPASRPRTPRPAARRSAARSGDAHHRREDQHRPGDRPPDRPARSERGGRSGPRR